MRVRLAGIRKSHQPTPMPPRIGGIVCPLLLSPCIETSSVSGDLPITQSMQSQRHRHHPYLVGAEHLPGAAQKFLKHVSVLLQTDRFARTSLPLLLLTNITFSIPASAA